MKRYCIRQNDESDCGAACLATIFKRNKLNISIAKIREAAGTDIQGTNIFGLIKAANKFGFEAKGIRVSCSSKIDYKELAIPCIAHVIIDDKRFHYVVIYSIKKNKIIMADPASGIIKVSLEDFLALRECCVKDKRYKWSGNLVILWKNENFSSVYAQYKHETEKLEYLKLLLNHKKQIGIIFTLSLIYTVFTIFGVFYYRLIMDYLIPNQLEDIFAIIATLFILLIIFRILLNIGRVRLALLLSKKLSQEIALNFYKHVIGLPMIFFDSRKVGEIVSRLQDSTEIVSILSRISVTLLIDILMILGGGIILSRQNLYMFLIVILMCFLYILLILCFKGNYSKLNKRRMVHIAKSTSYIFESLSGIETVKVFSAEKKIYKECAEKYKKVLEDTFELGWMENIQFAFKGLIEHIGEITILYVGGIGVIRGALTLGQLIFFSALLSYFINPLRNIIDLQSELQTAVIAEKRLREIFDLKIEKTCNSKKIKLNGFKNNIVFDKVNFKYGTRKDVLKNINFSINIGEKIAFVGESGSGKSTIVKLLIKMYSIEKGSIYIDGQSINNFSINDLRKKIIYVSQNTFLFSGTVLDNLIFGMEEEIKFSTVVEAAKMSKIHDFILNLPLGYETEIEEGGDNLSGGQRQRIAIARALLMKPQILILDEATSNLDASTEYELNKSIKKYCKYISVIVVTHRLSTIKESDNIFLLENGEIIESGSHYELIKKNGKYKKLVKLQGLELEEGNIEKSSKDNPLP